MNEIPWDKVLVGVGIVIAALVVFVVVHKVVKFLLSLLIAVLLAAVGVWYCVRAGYMSKETAEQLNPWNHAAVRERVKAVGAWVGDKAKTAVKDTVKESVRETVDEME